MSNAAELPLSEVKNNQKSKTVLESICEWSFNRPLWQRDAIRRIVQQNTISEEDHAELLTILKATHFSEIHPIISAIPIELAHISSGSSVDEDVKLEGISNIKGVNNLASNQVLKFSENGITVIYGDNGAGKSGYAKILKNACRARHRSKILPNIYDPNSDKNPSATITYQIGSKNNQSVNWQNSDLPDSILSAISVFDRECASVHIKKPNKVAYRPYGFDVPNVLADISKKLEEKLNKELQTLESKKNNIFLNTPWSASTQVGKAILGLSKTTKIEEIRNLASLSTQEQQRLTQLNEALSKDLRKAATEQKNKADHIKSLSSYLLSLTNLFAAENLDNIISLRESALENKKAAKLVATTTFSTDLLPDVGGSVWQKLWNSAREYSMQSAYPDKEFPYIEKGTKCVLCHQSLSEEASLRLKKFDAFVKSDLERKAKISEELFLQEYKKIPQKIDLSLQHNTLQDLKLTNYESYLKVMKFIASVRLRKIHFQRKFENPKQKLQELLSDYATDLQQLELNFRKSATELEMAIDEKQLNILKLERQELLDREILNQYIDAVVTEIDRLKNIDLTKLCIKDTKTTQITNLGNSIADDVITPQLRDGFIEEAKKLVGNRFKIETRRAGGSYGSPEYKISLLSDPNCDISTILSEGEQTCVGIASFLAELSTIPHKSALVFDDPISSLDHKWRSVVAERLVKEAKIRQVIVFTHDLIFLNDLENFAEVNDIEFFSQHLDRTPEIVGIVNDSLPWDGMKILARIDALEKEARNLNNNRSSMTDEIYKNSAKQFYSKLRASWERALEEIGLSNTVMRHRDYINSKELNKISALEQTDCKIWKDNFSKCCNFVEAHDAARGRNLTLPEPNVLLSDTITLKTWVETVKNKQKIL